MNKDKVVSPILLWLVIMVGIIILAVSTPDGQFFRRNYFTSLLAVLTAGYWMYFMRGALRSNRRAALSVDKTESIIQNGVYGIVRHPIYAADIILAWGIFLHWPYLRFFMGVFWLTLMLLFWMKLEELTLERKFGQVYSDYKKRVPMLVPRFWKKFKK